MALTSFDIIAIGTILCCLILSAMRGMVREIFEFFGWIIALFVAYHFALITADMLLSDVEQRTLAIIGGFILVYIVCRIILALITKMADAFIKAIKLGAINRLLGAMIGATKGVLIVSIAVLICSFTQLPKLPAWENALTAPLFENLAAYAIPYLPDFLQQKVHLPHYHSKIIHINQNQPIHLYFSSE